MIGVAQSKSKVVIKSVALPSEHGGWGFLIEPIILGMLVAGSWQGALLAVSAFGAFLIHQPLKVATKDRLKGRRPIRTIWAERFVVGYGLLAIVPMLILLATTPTTFLIPIALAIPFACVQLYYDARNKSRNLIPEVCGALALGMVAPSIAILGGWETDTALILWVILSLRAITAILYIQTRLKVEREKVAPVNLVWGLHVLALVVITVMSIGEITPLLTILAFGILLMRAYLGLSQYRKARPVKVIGFQELGYGILTVLIIALGYNL